MKISFASTLLLLSLATLPLQAFVIKTTVLRNPSDNRRVFLFTDLPDCDTDVAERHAEIIAQGVEEAANTLLIVESQEREADRRQKTSEEVASRACTVKDVLSSESSTLCDACTNWIKEVTFVIFQMEAMNPSASFPTTAEYLADADHENKRVHLIGEHPKFRKLSDQFLHVLYSVLWDALGVEAHEFSETLRSITTRDLLLEMRLDAEEMRSVITSLNSLSPSGSETLTRLFSTANTQIDQALDAVAECEKEFSTTPSILDNTPYSYLFESCSKAMSHFKQQCSDEHEATQTDGQKSTNGEEDSSEPSVKPGEAYLFKALEDRLLQLSILFATVGGLTEIRVLKTIFENPGSDVVVVGNTHTLQTVDAVLSEKGYKRSFESNIVCDGIEFSSVDEIRLAIQLAERTGQPCPQSVAPCSDDELRAFTCPYEPPPSFISQIRSTLRSWF